MLFALTSLAVATPIEVWSEDYFEPDDSTFADQNDDWDYSYERDPWYAGGGVLYSLTDDSVNNDPQAAENWVISGEDVQNVVVNAVLFNEDDDALGIVSNHDGKDSYYLLFHSADDAPPMGEGVDGPTLVLWRVEGGDAEELGRERADLPEGEVDFKLSVNGDKLRASLDGEVLITATDSDPLGAGQAGFYAYNTGYDNGGGGNTNAGATEIEVLAHDDDDDGVIDDVDNCEAVENPEQEDEDGDGIGDACDEDYEDPDGPGDDSGYVGDEVVIEGSCGGCGGGSGGGLLALGVLALLARRRD